MAILGTYRLSSPQTWAVSYSAPPIAPIRLEGGGLGSRRFVEDLTGSHGHEHLLMDLHATTAVCYPHPEYWRRRSRDAEPLESPADTVQPHGSGCTTVTVWDFEQTCTVFGSPEQHDEILRVTGDTQQPPLNMRHVWHSPQLLVPHPRPSHSNRSGAHKKEAERHGISHHRPLT